MNIGRELRHDGESKRQWPAGSQTSADGGQNLSSLTEIILSVCVQPSYKDFQDRVGSDVM